ncbi:UNKNOWN [Stylonychia lemnae]|uniref:Polymerase nucleotidyl transferase domain-containing protein n=1 Tax=Stylonychia lemnae TaxID=5949 RepID=A0A078APB2_STYLE|nr:UNKNOWN [Stylonychia lemnae]|eukprot:CDW83969.1 UNKNOWN [Stylonychia lemnae]
MPELSQVMGQQIGMRVIKLEEEELVVHTPSVEQNSSKQTVISSSSHSPQDCKLFFESPSKYVSLKKHRLQNEDFQYNPESLSSSGSSNPILASNDNATIAVNNSKTGEQAIENSSTPIKYTNNENVFGGKVEKGLGIRQWFEQLSLADKSIVLTVVDKQLVNLIVNMYQCSQNHQTGKFTNQIYPNIRPNEYDRLRPYNILYKGQNLSITYESKSSYLQQYFIAEQELRNSIRLLNLNHREEQRIANENKIKQLQQQRKQSSKSVKSQADLKKIRIYDAFTLDLKLILNTQFFFQIMNKINQNQDNFLKNELHNGQDDPTAGHYENRKETEKPRKFYTIIPSASNYACRDKTGEFSLAQCLYTIFEKAINVQYLDYLGKLNQDHQNFFFTTPQFDIFTYDMKLSYFWLSMDSEKRKKAIKNLDELEKKIESEIHTKTYQFEGIKELNEEYESSSNYNSNNRKRDEENTPYFYSNTNAIKSQRSQSNSAYSDNFENDDEELESDLEQQTSNQLSRFRPKNQNSQSQAQIQQKKIIERNQNDYALSKRQQELYGRYTENKANGKLTLKDQYSKYRNDEDDESNQNNMDHDEDFSIEAGQQERTKNHLKITNNYFKTAKTKILVDSNQAQDLAKIPLEFYQQLIQLYEKSVFEDLMNYDDSKTNNNGNGQSSGGNKNQKAITNASSNESKVQLQSKKSTQEDKKDINSEDKSLQGVGSNPSKKNKKKKNKNKNKGSKETTASVVIEQDKIQNQISRVELKPESISESKIQILQEQRQLELVKKLMKNTSFDNQELSEKIQMIRQEEEMNQRRIEEARSLLTGEVQYHKLSDGEYGIYQPPKIQDIETNASQNTDNQQDAQKKKKKKRKNNKHKNKNNAKAPVQQPENNYEKNIKIVQEARNKIAEILSQEDMDDNNDILKSVHEILQNIDEVDEIESINLDQIEINVKNEDEDQNNDEHIENLIQMVEEKKFNNYLLEVKDENQTPVQVLSNEDTLEEDETKNLARDITADICKKVIFAANSNLEDEQEEIIHQTAKKDNNSKKNRRNSNKMKQLLKSDPQNTKNQPYPQLYTNMQFLEHPQSPRSNSKKHVEFKIPIDENEEEIKIPKRGSSRGSSVGTEDVIHQHTLSSLGELFPSEYKNPSDDTKIKIIEITTSSNNSSVSPRRSFETQAKVQTTEIVKKQSSYNQQSQNQAQLTKQNSQPQKQPENLSIQNKKRNSQHQSRKTYEESKDYHNHHYTDNTQYQQTNTQRKDLKKDNLNVNQQNNQINQEQKKASPQTQRTKKDKNQNQNKQSILQANFDSYQSMFQTAYNDNPKNDNRQNHNHGPNQHNDNKQQLYNQKNISKKNSQTSQNQPSEQKTEEISQQIEERKQDVTDELVQVGQLDQTQQNQIQTVQNTQDVQPQPQIVINQPLINLKKPKKPRQENRDLREQGISVNPDILMSVNKKNQQAQQNNNNNNNSNSNNLNQNLSHNKKQIKAKPFKAQQLSSSLNQQMLNLMPLEQRSQTPIVEQTNEPLTGYSAKHSNQHNNNLNNNQNNFQKKQNQNHKQFSSNNQGNNQSSNNNKGHHKKKSSNLGYHQQQSLQNQQIQFQQQQNHLLSPQLNQFLTFEQAQIQQQQQQQLLNQSIMNLAQVQNTQQMLQPPQLFQPPQLNPQMYFNPLMHQNQGFLLPPPSPTQQIPGQQQLIPTSLSPQPNQTPQQLFNQHQFIYPFQQQLVFPKFQSTQETQTEQNVQDGQGINKDNIQMGSGGQKEQGLNQQQLQNQQNQNLQTMINQIQNINNDYSMNINIQVYQMPFQTQPFNIFNNFNQGMIEQQLNPQYNPFMMQNLPNQLFNPATGFPQPTPFIPQISSPLIMPTQNQSFSPLNQAPQTSQFNQPFTNFQMNNTPRNVSHQTLDQYKNQNREELFFKKFDREIYKLQIKQQMKLQKTEHERQTAFKIIEQFVKEAYQGKALIIQYILEYVDVKIQMYGSMATGLAIDSSDMDVLVSGVFNQEGGVIDRLNLIEQMKRLHKQLNKLYCLESNSIIETATVPVIKIVRNQTLIKIQIIDLQKIRDAQSNGHHESVAIEEDMKHLKIDITFNDQENEQNINGVNFAQPLHLGIKCCHYIKQKLSEYPQLQSLSLLLKKFLALRDLNSPFLAFINQDLPQTYDPSTDMLSPARIFTQFLIYFGRIFDVKLSMINEYQQIVPLPFLTFSSVLIILDPLNTNNNIGKSTYNFDQIRNEFTSAYEKILTMHKEFIENKDGLESIESEIEEFKSQKLSILNKVLYDEFQENELCL